LTAIYFLDIQVEKVLGICECPAYPCVINGFNRELSRWSPP